MNSGTNLGPELNVTMNGNENETDSMFSVAHTVLIKPPCLHSFILRKLSICVELKFCLSHASGG